MINRPDATQRVATLAKALPQSERPTRRMIGWLVVAVLAAHLALLWGMTGSLDWRLQTADSVRVSPLQTRWLPPAAQATASAKVAKASQPRTRVATAPTPPTVPVPVPAPQVPSEFPAESATPEAPETLTKTPSPTNTTAEAAATETISAPATQVLAAAEVAPANMSTSTTLPPIPLGALPPSVLLSYKLTGQEKGLNYFANGELRWQHNEAAYALSLSVKAFLVGSRHWRSVGQINETGLAPNRFSDSWRNERAAHFDRINQRVVFSSNAPVAPLEAGAQDQISLYVQLAAAMAGNPQRFEPGTRLQVQTATIRDALPWLLTLGANETLQLNGQAVATAKWVCQPRNRFDATVEFWVSAQHAWMPVRIRITQVSGSFIDLLLSGQEALPPLAAQTAPTTNSFVPTS
jgi:hypothetical protein